MSAAAPGRSRAAARRAVVRWSWRLFRREWRGQLLLIALLSFTVAGAILGGSAAYNLQALPNVHFGSATQLLTLDATRPKALAADIAAARKTFGTIDVIGHRYAPLPGSVDTVELRAQAPAGPYGGSMLALDAGRYPAGAHEADLTQHLSRALGVGIGGELTLGGERRRVVGLVEDPLDLSEQFVLISPSGAGPLQSATVLLKADPGAFAAFRTSVRAVAFETVGGGSRTVATGLALVAAVVLLLLIALVASAGFSVIARRRLRQLGMLAAVGATERHLRLVMLAGGAMVGAIAALIGSLAGVASWAALSPVLETAANHRLAPFGLPWSLVGAVVCVALVVSTGAAWWPARAVSRVPIVEALSDRPPAPRPAHRATLLGAGFLLAGVAGLAVSDQRRPPLLILGVLGVVLGVLFLSPLGIRLLAGLGRGASIGVRLPLRDLARHQARSAAALAAISLALGIAFAIIVVASAAQHDAGAGNLSSRQVLVRIGQPGDPVIPRHTASELDTLAAQVGRMASTLARPSIIGLFMAYDPTVKPVPPSPDGGAGGQPVAELDVPMQPATVSTGRQSGTFRAHPLYVATPALLGYLGVKPASLAPGTELLTPLSGELTIADIPAAETLGGVQRLAGQAYTSAPTSAVTVNALRRFHWGQIAAGWLVESSTPLTSAQIAQARAIAAGAGLSIETRDYQRPLVVVRLGAACAGLLLALGVLAMTVGLIRSEAAAETRVLVAVGASSRVQRTLTAATAGALALMGVALGLLAAYVALAAAYRSDLGALSHVPTVYLLSIAIGVPGGAFLAGWLSAGREPLAIMRRAIE